MKIELKKSGIKEVGGFEFWHLYIDNKTDKFRYDERGMAGFICPDAERLRHLKKLRTIPCSDLPDELRLWNITDIDAPPGQINSFGIERKDKKIKSTLNFSFKTDSYKKYFLNPFRLFDKMIKNAKKMGVHAEYMEYEAPMDDLRFTFDYDLKGTVGDKLDEGCRIIFKIAQDMELENRAEVWKFLKAKSAPNSAKIKLN